MHKRMLVLSFIVLAIALASVSFTNQPTAETDPPRFKNLKVLNKNITKDELEVVMKGFKTALGVKCGFCHAQSKVDPSKLDFASDEKDEKKTARGMLRMAMRINKKYFKDEKEPRITCFTCHHGDKEPMKPPVEVPGR